jgi:Flp pilus assembly protein TadG
MPSRFVSSREGNVATLFALALIPLVGSAGAAIDYGQAARTQAKLQSAIDAAVLAGAKDGSAAWTTAAQSTFRAAYGAAGPTPSFARDGTAFTGSVNTTVPTAVLQVLGFPTIAVAASASAATTTTALDESCILALDKGADASKSALTFNGAPNVALSGCTIRSNGSMRCNGHGTGASASIAVGTVSGCSNPQPGGAPVADIYAPLAKSIERKCTSATGATWRPGTPPSATRMVTVQKGAWTEYHVCGSLTLAGSGALGAGTNAVIVIENGSLIMDNDATIDASGVAFVLTGDGTVASEIVFPNGKGKAATLTLSPPTAASHPWRGVSIYQDPALTKNVDHDWGPGTILNADGVIYLPNADLRIHGSPSSNNPLCTKLVVSTFTSNGAVNLKQTAQGCATLGVTQSSSTVTRLKS